MGRQRRADAEPLNWDRFDIAPILLVVIPGGLILAALLISVMTGVPSGGWSPAVLIALSVAAFALQCSWIRAATLPSSTRVLIFLAQFALTAALIWVSPFYGIYVFIGYLTALMMFSGARLWIALGANAVLAAASQIGGFGQIPHGWPAFVVLVFINTGLVVLFSWVGARRDREIGEREAAVRALEEVQLRNSELQEQLLLRARAGGARGASPTVPRDP